MAFERADIVLASTEDLELLFQNDGLRELLSYAETTEIVLKLATPACRIIAADLDEQIDGNPVTNVVDNHSRRRQLRGRILGGAARGAFAALCRALGTPHGRNGGPISWRDYPPCEHAERPSVPSWSRKGDEGMTLGASLSRTSEMLSELFGLGPVFPVLTIERVDDALPLARALVAGGLRLLEVTLRTRAGRDAAVAIINEVSDAIVGIGTVLTSQDLALCQQIGARFALCPGATTETLHAAAVCDIPFMPGVATASELMAAVAHGFDIVKFFPAVPAGGIAALKAMGGPFPKVRICPTGGVNESNAADWLALSNVMIAGGSWLTPASDIQARA